MKFIKEKTMKIIQVTLLLMVLTCSVYAGDIPNNITATGDISNDVAAAAEIQNDMTDSCELPDGVTLLTLLTLLLR
jgi:hypothetical protein